MLSHFSLLLLVFQQLSTMLLQRLLHLPHCRF